MTCPQLFVESSVSHSIAELMLAFCEFLQPVQLVFSMFPVDVTPTFLQTTSACKLSSGNSAAHWRSRRSIPTACLNAAMMRSWSDTQLVNTRRNAAKLQIFCFTEGEACLQEQHWQPHRRGFASSSDAFQPRPGLGFQEASDFLSFCQVQRGRAASGMVSSGKFDRPRCQGSGPSRANAESDNARCRWADNGRIGLACRGLAIRVMFPVFVWRCMRSCQPVCLASWWDVFPCAYRARPWLQLLVALSLVGLETSTAWLLPGMRFSENCARRAQPEDL